MKRRVYTYLQLFKEGLIESLAGIVNIHMCVTAAIADVLGINHNYTGNRLITKAWAINEPDDPDPINPEPQHTYDWEYAFSASTAVPVTGWGTLSSDTQLIYYNPNTPYLHFRMYCDNQLVNEDVQDYEIFYKNPSNNTIPTHDHLYTKVLDGPNRYYCEYDRTIESPMVRMITSASGSTDNVSWFYAFSTTADTPQQFVSIPSNNTIINDSNYNYLWILCIDSDLNLQNINPINNPSDYEAYIENNGTQIIYGPSEQYNYWNKVDVSGLSGAVSMQLRKSSEVQTNITYERQQTWYYQRTFGSNSTPVAADWNALSEDISLPSSNSASFIHFHYGDYVNTFNANDSDYTIYRSVGTGALSAVADAHCTASVEAAVVGQPSVSYSCDYMINNHSKKVTLQNYILSSIMTMDEHGVSANSIGDYSIAFGPIMHTSQNDEVYLDNNGCLTIDVDWIYYDPRDQPSGQIPLRLEVVLSGKTYFTYISAPTTVPDPQSYSYVSEPTITSYLQNASNHNDKIKVNIQYQVRNYNPNENL